MLERQQDSIKVRLHETDGQLPLHDELTLVRQVPDGMAGIRRKDLPDGINTLDLRQHTDQDTGEIGIQGSAVGGELHVQLEKGIGAVDLEPGVEIVVSLENRHKRLLREAPRRSKAVYGALGTLSPRPDSATLDRVNSTQVVANNDKN